MGRSRRDKRVGYWRKGYHASPRARESRRDKPRFTGIYANMDGLTENKLKEIKLICAREYDSESKRTLTTQINLINIFTIELTPPFPFFYINYSLLNREIYSMFSSIRFHSIFLVTTVK